MGADCKSVGKPSKVRILHPPHGAQKGPHQPKRPVGAFHVCPAMCSYDQPFTGVHGEYAEIFHGPVSGGLSIVFLPVHCPLNASSGCVFLAHDAFGVDP